MNDDVRGAQSFLDRLMNGGAALGSREIGDDEHLLRQPVRSGTRGREHVRSEFAKVGDDGGADTFRSRGDEHASARELQVETHETISRNSIPPPAKRKTLRFAIREVSP